ASYASIRSATVAEEPRPWGHPEPCTGLGMTRALRDAADASFGAESRRIGWTITDVVNERHRVDEWQAAFTRLFPAFVAEVPHEQPLLETGDVGAATVPLIVAMTCVRWQTGCGIADTALVAAHSDGVERGAVVLAQEGAS